jgi:hypothetical protein
VRVHHSNGHAHTHELPATISGMVWRGIVWEGKNKFSDGLAIRVGFFKNINGLFWFVDV